MKFLFFPLLLLVLFSSAQDIDGIIPKPVSVQAMRGTVVINNQSRIVYDRAFEKQAAYLAAAIGKQTGLKLQLRLVSDPELNQSTTIGLVFDSVSVTRPEMYILDCRSNFVTIKGRDVKGIVNGIQSLLQLFSIGKTTEAELPAVIITDYPRFAYRGMHLDVVRHFFPVDFIKKYIDYLTFHKLNTFHWHLTDDQGWRIEMLNYKKLNEIGSWREATLIGHFRDQPARYDSTRYGGFYTREEIKEIIEYASLRGITVIPEIDIPGHSRSIIASYPEFSTNPNEKWKVATTWGMYNRQNNVLAPRPQTFEFLRTVFHEIADLFPSEYIHVGGDECSKMWWKADPITQQFMKENGIKDESALQAYFIDKVAGFLAEKNKKIIGWHEIMEGNVDRSAIVMNWANEKTALQAARKGHSIIMTPGKPLYFDHYQSEGPHDSLSIHGHNPLETVYNFEPLPAELMKLQLDHLVIGGQANLWTEYIAYPTKVDYMVFPRMTALSEVLWTPPSKKNYKGFLERVRKYMVPRYEFWNSSYFPTF